MSGSGKAGNGRGNNRKRPFRRWSKDNNTWQEGNVSNRNGASNGNDNSRISAMGTPTETRQGRGSPQDKKAQDRGQVSENQGRQNRSGFSKRGGENPRGEKAAFFERPKWVPPKINTDPLPVPDCPWCGKPIRDISLAMTDKDSGAPVHFECVTARIAGGENLEKGDVLTYIGGGRFGIVCFVSSGESRDSAGDSPREFPRESPTAGHDFKIKKIIEWENKDKRAEWRSVICEHFSIT